MFWVTSDERKLNPDPNSYSFSKPENLTQSAMGEDVIHVLPHNELLCAHSELSHSSHD